MKKPLILLIVFLTVIYTSLGMLTLKVLQNQSQTHAYQQRQQGERDSAQLHRFINNELAQVQTQLSAITQFLEISPTALQQLIEQTAIIEQLFIIEGHRLRYPNVVNADSVTADEKRLIMIATPFANDPSRLLQRGHGSEDSQANFGWYYAPSTPQPLLIYWQKKEELIIGYQLSYTAFRAQLIIDAEHLGLPGHYQLIDDGQLLLSNQSQFERDLPDDLSPITTDLAYPLQHWSIRYYPRNDDALSRLPTLLSVLALAAVITLIAIVIYRQTQRKIRLAQQQVQFVSQVSHELKTPLTNIHLYAELLQEYLIIDTDDITPNDPSSRYINVIMDESQRLSRLIQNVLNFSKLPQPRYQTLMLDDLLTQLQQIFTPIFQQKGLTIYLNNTLPVQTTLVSDTDLVIQILSNFMSNAEKYAIHGKRVDIEAHATPNHYCLAIRDYGNGVAKHELKQLSKPFYRVNNHLTEGVSGTGIGLSIATQLANRLGGKIVLENAHPGLRCQLFLPKN